MPRNLRRIVLPLIPIGLGLAAWEVAARLGTVNGALFPPPSTILREVIGLHTRQWPERSLLLAHVAASLRRAAIACLIGAGAGIVCGLLIGVSRWVRRLLDPLITVLMPIPGIALAPLFIVWMGFGDPTIITIGAMASFFPITLGTATGVRSIDPQLVRAAQTMGARPLGTLITVYLPWSAGHLLAALKLGWARCWRTVIAVEFVAAASWGLGYMIWDASEYIRTGVVYGGLALLMLLYLLVERGVFESVERLTVRRWGMIRS